MNAAKFLAKHWLTLALLLGSLVLVVWIVRTQRAPGSMTVVEAQGMDMTTSKPPVGVQPVAVEAAANRSVGGSTVYPATITALTDEDVVARIQGRVSKVLVYPGDRVEPGRLLATIDADELAAQASEARLMALSKHHMALGTEHDIEERTAMFHRAKASLEAAKSGVAKSKAELAAAEAERRQARSESGAMQADVAEAEAQLKYSVQEFAREQRLYKAGAVALDELQSATKERDMSAARARSAQAKAKAAEQMVDAADRKIQAARRMVDESAAGVKEARADLDAATTNVAKAVHEKDVATVEASAYSAGESAARTTASYRDLRAQSTGVVVERAVSPGTAVMPGQMILKIKALDTVRVQADLPQDLFGAVREGTHVTLVAGGKTRAATVGSVFPLVDENSRTFRIEARIPNADHAFAPGMYGKLRIETSAAREVLAVRSAAVQSDADGSHYVWLLAEKTGGSGTTDWTCTMHPEISESGPGKCPKCGMDLVPRERSGKYVAEKHTVQIGPADDLFTAVTNGLKPGDKVIWAGFENLQPGMAVQPTEWGPDGPVTLPGTDAPSQAKPSPSPASSDPSPSPLAPRPSLAYICPMRCKGSESDKPGICPVCGMKLVKASTLKGAANGG